MSSKQEENDSSDNEYGNHSVDFTDEDLIKFYVNRRVLAWCKENHPEIFKESEVIFKNILEKKETTGNILDEKS